MDGLINAKDYIGTYTEEEIELNKKLYDECCKEVIDFVAVEELLKAGVRIFEYTPGFVHAKVFVSDDKKAVVGTINLDYRSLYLHFECAALLYQVEEIGRIEQDFEETLAQCQEISLESLKKEKWYMKVCGWLLKVLAPLM